MNKFKNVISYKQKPKTIQKRNTTHTKLLTQNTFPIFQRTLIIHLQSHRKSDSKKDSIPSVNLTLQRQLISA